MNKLKALVIFLSAACIGTFAYIAMLPGFYGQPVLKEPAVSSDASISSQPEEGASPPERRKQLPL